MEQKFKRGNKVKVLFGHAIWSSKGGVTDMSPEEVGKEALIVGSYADQFGGDNRKDYTIMFCETGSEVSWKSERQLELVEEGGEHLFAEVKAKQEEISKKNTDLSHVVKTWVENKGRVSSETVLFLFEKIGFDSMFLKNGEFYSLYSEWTCYYPILNAVMTAQTESDATSLLSEKCPDTTKNKIVELFNEVQAIKSA